MKNIFLLLLVTSAVSLFAQDKMPVFTSVEIDGPVKIELIQSDDYKIEILEESELVNWEINGESLVVIAQYRKGYDTPKVRIHVKELKKLHVSGQVILKATGTFETRRMNIQLNSQSIVNINIDTEELDVKINQQSILGLSGAADDFSVNADQQSILNAKELQCAIIEVSANHQSVVGLQREGATVKSDVKNQSIVN